MHECFADEIAIDFPSVGHVVERMRDAFLGEAEDRELVCAEVALSPREATDGLTVSVEVPIRATCAECGGRGETWTEPCGSCSGTGESLFRHPVKVLVPPGVPDGARVRFRVNSPDAPAVRVEVRVIVRPAAI
jgi:DnaJ-class molecular chaperone